MTCPICNQKIDPSDHSEKWGPEFAHSRCVIAFTAGSAIQDAKLQDRIKQLEECVTAKWFWMMDYCKNKSVSPALGWQEAETEWNKMAKEAKP